MEIEYRVPEHDSERISLEITINPNRYTVDQIAVSAAEDWFYNHEGIDSAWPIDFEIYVDNELPWNVKLSHSSMWHCEKTKSPELLEQLRAESTEVNNVRAGKLPGRGQPCQAKDADLHPEGQRETLPHGRKLQ